MKKKKTKKLKQKKVLKVNDNEQKRQNKFDSFFMICLTTIIGYFLKYFFNLIITEQNDNKKMNIWILSGVLMILIVMIIL